MCLGGEPKNVEKILVDLDKRVNGRVPFATHWYNWHKIPFDHSYPNYFPTKDGFAETTARMKEKGQLIMPYINGRLWDMDIDSFPTEGIKSAAKNEKGEPYIEIYASKRRLVPNCPFTTQWQNKIQEICSRLMNECGVNGIYLDQIGAATPKLCFDPTHNHPIGGGRHWCDGYRAMLTPIKKMAAEKGVTLTTENIAEPYMDNIDGYLTWVQRNQEDVPAMTAVYSGYAIYFTSWTQSIPTISNISSASARCRRPPRSSWSWANCWAMCRMPFRRNRLRRRGICGRRTTSRCRPSNRRCGRIRRAIC